MWKSLSLALSALLFFACGSVEDPPTDSQGDDPVADAGSSEPNSEADSEQGVSETPERKSPPFELVEGQPMYTVLPVDAIPAIDEPVFVGVVEAMSFMADDEPVLGVVGKDGTAKCYSAWNLEGHEIVNDELDGVAIAATW